jgi:hypothetical protein
MGQGVRVAWVELFEEIGARLVLRDGASAERLDELERRLGDGVSAELRDLLAETDGFDDVDGQWEMAWSSTRVASETERFRRDGLLGHTEIAFGDNGCGEPFCLDAEGTVSVIYPIGGERMFLAPSLVDFWAGWLRGRITTLAHGAGGVR